MGFGSLPTLGCLAGSHWFAAIVCVVSQKPGLSSSVAAAPLVAQGRFWGMGGSREHS